MTLCRTSAAIRLASRQSRLDDISEHASNSSVAPQKDATSTSKHHSGPHPRLDASMSWSLPMSAHIPSSVKRRRTCPDASNLDIPPSGSCFHSVPAFVVSSNTHATTATTHKILTVVLCLATIIPGARAQGGASPDQPVCIGDGLDVSSLGLLSTLVLPTVVGLSLWVSTAFLVWSGRDSDMIPEDIVRHSATPIPTGVCLARMVCTSRVSFQFRSQ